LFDRPGGPYGDPATGHDWPDNWKRFAALSKVAADIAGGLGGLDPDVVHAHDWQAAMTPAYMRHGNARAAATPSVLTIHNMAFQGRYGADIFDQLGLPHDAWSISGVEYYGGVGYLKAGMQMASRVTTVSPTYAHEIRDPSFGMGLEGLVAARGSDVRGIVNGIDTAIWDPALDPALTATYSAATLRERQDNKRAVEAEFGLARDDGPIFCVISRLTWQKGMDVLCEVADSLVGMGGRLALLGAGDAALEGALMGAAHRHPGRIGVRIGYDEALSHLMQGGSDAILIPSRFEPCGLTQLYGLRYGCVPIVARTGGLADTVIDANEAALSDGVATGFQFSGVSADGLSGAISRALSCYHRPEQWRSLQKRGMKSDVSWGRSARRYAELYRELTKDAG
jgi:starch synthase